MLASAAAAAAVVGGFWSQVHPSYERMETAWRKKKNMLTKPPIKKEATRSQAIPLNTYFTPNQTEFWLQATKYSSAVTVSGWSKPNSCWNLSCTSWQTSVASVKRFFASMSWPKKGRREELWTNRSNKKWWGLGPVVFLAMIVDVDSENS